MGRNKDLTDFNNDRIVMVWRQVQSTSEMERLLGSSWSAVVRIYQQCPSRDKP